MYKRIFQGSGFGREADVFGGMAHGPRDRQFPHGLEWLVYGISISKVAARRKNIFRLLGDFKIVDVCPTLHLARPLVTLDRNFCPGLPRLGAFAGFSPLA